MYRDFYENPAIVELGRDRAWTISDASKMPVSQRALLGEGLLRGASSYVPEDMLTLDDLVSTWPDATNNALFLRDRGRYAILDIEPTATEACRRIMLSTPWLYGEVSMSGKGLHLIVPYPEDLLIRYPNARKSTSKHESGTYELHLQHWVTFTRRTIERPDTWGTVSLEEALTPLLSQQRAPIATPTTSSRLRIIESSGKRPSEADCLDGLPEWWQRVVPAKFGNHTPQGCGNDASRYDFKFALYIAHRLIDAVVSEHRDMPTFEEATDICYRTLYWAILHQMKWREKVDSMRGGLTYLELTCQKAVESAMNDIDALLSEEDRQEQAETATCAAPETTSQSPHV
jgi:hypothetical protein